MFVFVHIPKTAGTALGYAFDYSSGRRVFWDYNENYSFADRLQPEIQDNIDFIAKYFRVIYGHFLVTKYMNVLPKADYLTCVRHPVDRLISQYHHVGYEGTSWQGKLISKGEMNVVEFAKNENLASAQFNHLKGKPLSEFGHIFVNEHLNTSVKLFQKKFDFRFTVGVPTLNTNKQRSEAAASRSPKMAPKIRPVMDEDRVRLFGLCEKDVEVYKKAVELHKEELKRIK